MLFITPPSFFLASMRYLFHPFRSLFFNLMKEKGEGKEKRSPFPPWLRRSSSPHVSASTEGIEGGESSVHPRSSYLYQNTYKYGKILGGEKKKGGGGGKGKTMLDI